MDDLWSVLFIVLFIGSLAYVIYFRPKFDVAKDALIFDNRVLSVIDGLYLSGMHFGCTDFEMREYVRHLLQKAHKLPGNQTLLSHTSITNATLSSHSHKGLHGEHITFALLCIIEYGKDHDKVELIKQCEQMLIDARIMEAHYR